MKLPRDLSGSELVKALRNWDMKFRGKRGRTYA